MDTLNDIITLDERYSTTRRVRQEDPAVIAAELKAAQKPEDQFETLVFLPEGEGRQGEGGLRTQGYFKRSEPEKPLITVVTVVFNGEKYLEETILSVINQTYDNVEYIIVDGASTDGTLDIIRKYEHAIDYWVSERDRGIYDAMNTGAKLAHGDALSYMNAGDCIVDKGFYKLINRYQELKLNNLSLFVAYGNNLWRGSKNPGIKFLPKFLPLLGRLPSHQSMLIPRLIQLRFPYDLTFPVSSDRDFKIAIYHKKIKYFRIDSVVCISEPGGISQTIQNYKQLINRAEETLAVMSKNCNSIYSIIYSIIFLFWNVRKILKNPIKNK
jgi:glycosyltransferase involved in cell wall biosynthesis